MNTVSAPGWQVKIKTFFALGPTRDAGFALAIGLFGVLLLLAYQPTFLMAPGKYLPDGGVSLQNYWVVAHGIRMWKSMSLTTYFDGNQYFPFGQTLAFGDHYLLPSLAATCLTWLGAGSQAAYGILLILLFAFQFAAFAWSARLLKVGHGPAALGAILFGVNQGRWATGGNLAMLLVGILPVLLAIFVQFCRTGQRAWMAAFATLVGVMALSGRETLVLCLPALAGCFFWWGKMALRRPVILKSTAIAWLVLIALIALVYRPYLRTENLYGEQVTHSLRLLGSEKWGSLFNPGETLRLMKFMARPPAGSAAGGAFLSIVQWLVVLSSCLICVAALVRRSWQQRKVFLKIGAGFLAILVLVAFAAMGPRAEGEMFGFNVWRVLMWIPGFESVHAPAHIFIMGHLCIAIAAVWVVSKGGEIFSKMGKQMLPVCATLAVIQIVQMWPAQSWDWRSPDESSATAAISAMAERPKAPVAILPVRANGQRANGERANQERANQEMDQIISAKSAHPVLGGGGDYVPPVTLEWIVPGLEHCDTHACINALQNLGVQYLLVNDAQVDAAARSFIPRSNLIKKVEAFDRWTLYQFGSVQPAKKLALGTTAWWKRQAAVKTEQCVPPAHSKMSERMERSSLASDGMIGTAWQTRGVQGADQWVEFPLGPEHVGKDVVIDLESGFDGDLRNALFVRSPEVKWVKAAGLVKEEIFENQVSLREPLVILQQIQVKVPADATAIRIAARASSSHAPSWGIAESRLCLQQL